MFLQPGLGAGVLRTSCQQSRKVTFGCPGDLLKPDCYLVTCAGVVQPPGITRHLVSAPQQSDYQACARVDRPGQPPGIPVGDDGHGKEGRIHGRWRDAERGEGMRRRWSDRGLGELDRDPGDSECRHQRDMQYRPATGGRGQECYDSGHSASRRHRVGDVAERRTRDDEGDCHGEKYRGGDAAPHGGSLQSISRQAGHAEPQCRRADRRPQHRHSVRRHDHLCPGMFQDPVL
jgi:hypothetical protein